MISAKEAREKTDQIRQRFQDNAQTFVNDELYLIEKRILLAISEGNCTTDYWWSKSCFDEAETQREYVIIALKRTLKALEYKLGNIVLNTHGAGSLEINISW